MTNQPDVNDEWRVGDVIADKYEVTEILGRGGMGRPIFGVGASRYWRCLWVK